MQRPQPTQPEESNWSIHVASLCVSHCRYREAVDLIGNEITSKSELVKTRKVLRDSANKAHALVKKLEKTNKKLAELTKAANLMASIVKKLATVV